MALTHGWRTEIANEGVLSGHSCRTRVRWDSIIVSNIHVTGIHVYELRLMGKRAVDPPLVTEWLRCSKHRSKEQYASELRNFLKQRGSSDFSTVTPAELCDYVVALRESRRRRAISALLSFFEFRLEKSPTSGNPAIRLWESVQTAVEDRQTQLDLRRAGVEDPDALRWRDVGVVCLLRDADYRNVSQLIPGDSAIVKALFARLITGIRETPLPELEDFLDSKVLSRE